MWVAAYRRLNLGLGNVGWERGSGIRGAGSDTFE